MKWRTFWLPLFLFAPIVIPADITSGKLVEKRQLHKKHYEEEARQQRGKDFLKKRLLLPIKVTKYNPERNQTDSTPFIMASNKRVYDGAIALSRDIEEKYGYKFGDLVFLENLGTFVFQDRMNKKWTNRADIFSFNKKESLRFGMVEDNLIIVR